AQAGNSSIEAGNCLLLSVSWKRSACVREKCCPLNGARTAPRQPLGDVRNSHGRQECLFWHANSQMTKHRGCRKVRFWPRSEPSIRRSDARSQPPHDFIEHKVVYLILRHGGSLWDLERMVAVFHHAEVDSGFQFAQDRSQFVRGAESIPRALDKQ